MNTDLIVDGLKAMVLGMGMVYVFLIIMIWVMRLTSKLLKPFEGLLEPAAAPVKKTAVKNVMSDEALANAAVAAVKLFRESNATAPQSFNIPVNGASLSVAVAPGVNTAVPAAADGAGNLKPVVSPLPGTLMSIAVAVGDKVESGDRLAVIEAMKMETEILAEEAGIICQIPVAVKDVVAADDTLFLVEVAK